MKKEKLTTNNVTEWLLFTWQGIMVMNLLGYLFLMAVILGTTVIIFGLLGVSNPKVVEYVFREMVEVVTGVWAIFMVIGILRSLWSHARWSKKSTNRKGENK